MTTQEYGIRSASELPPFRRLLKSPFLWIVLLSAVLIVPLVLRHQAKTQDSLGEPLGSLPAFTLKDQEGASFTTEAFRGHISIVNFIFTSCPDVCPLLTRQMATLQKTAADRHLDLKLVSVSVDPETDTPPVLKKYAGTHQADLRNWSFVTGPIEAIQKVIVEGFKMGVDRQAKMAAKGAQPVDAEAAKLDPADIASLMEITHGEQFVLVDDQARIRAYATANNNVEIDALLGLAQQLK